MKKVFLFLILLLTMVGCDLFTDSSESSTPLHKSISDNGIEFSVDIPTNNFSLYDTLSVTFKVKNYSTSMKEFNFANMQQLAFQLIDKNNNVAMFYPYIVSPALSNFILNPGETKELNQNSLFKHHSGNYINRGNYTLSVFLADKNSPKLELEISVN
jgi:hypothetical protein